MGLHPSLKVIIVDDSVIVVDRLLLMLQDIEDVVVVNAVYTIDSAEDLIKIKKPDVVIFDFQIENDKLNKDGLSFLITLRSLFPDIKIIVYSNRNELVYRLNCLTYGADFFFDKSYDFERIPEALRTIQAEKNQTIF